MKPRLSCAVAFFCLVTIATSARAEFGVKVTGNGSTTSGEWTLGYQFTVGSAPIQVTDLGYFDFNQDGFTNSHQVGIWKMDGTLVTSGFVENANPVNAFFRWKPIAPVILSANTAYKVAGTTGSDQYSWENPGFTVGTGITFNTDVYKSGAFGFPTASEGRLVGNPGIFGANISYTFVPECSTLALATVAIWSLGFRRSNGSRRKPRHTAAGLPRC
jgi:hypothetical protein